MTRYAIVGNGVAGLAAAVEVRRRDPTGEIVLLHDEPSPPYFRAGLSEWMHGRLEDEELLVRPVATLERLGIRQVHARVERVEPDTHRLVFGGRTPLAWDRLLVATGASPIVPPWPGRHLEGVHTYRSRADAETIRRSATARPEQPVVIIGGGILGLEMAYDCKGLGVPAVLLNRDDQVGRPLFDAPAGECILRRLVDDDVTVLLDEEVERFEGAGDELVAVRTDRERRIACSAVVVAVGVRPNVALLEGSGVTVKGHVVVDERMRTSRPDVFAAGDVATVWDPVLERYQPTRTWEPSFLGGRVAGANMAGGDERMVPCATMNASLVYDLPYALVGAWDAMGPEVDLLSGPSRGRYAYRQLRLMRGRLVGGTLLEDRRQLLALLRLIQLRVDVRRHREQLFADDFDLNLLLPPGGWDYWFF